MATRLLGYSIHFLKLTNASFAGILEHFRKSKTIDKFFNSEFPDFNSYVIPGYREPGQDSGRPKAGIAQLSTKSLQIKKTRTFNFDDQKLMEILSEIQSIMDNKSDN